MTHPSDKSMKPRPDAVFGETHHISTSSGDLFVTVNEDESGQPFEVFVTIGKSGGFVSSFTEAIGRLVSLCLRSGISPLVVAKQLVGIRGPRPSFHRGVQILSVPDAIGRVLLKHMKKSEEALQHVEEDPSIDDAQSIVLDDDEGSRPEEE